MDFLFTFVIYLVCGLLSDVQNLGLEVKPDECDLQY